MFVRLEGPEFGQGAAGKWTDASTAEHGDLLDIIRETCGFAGFHEVADEARRREVDGVVCGHIHHAEIREIDGVLYCNDGDWVESCTALVEHFDGTLELIDWIERWALDPLSGRLPARAEVEEDDEIPVLVGRVS